MTIREAIKKCIPSPALRLRQQLLVSRARRRFRDLTTEEAFTEIYARRLWGVGSGHGSDERFTNAYCDYVVRFCEARGIGRVVDIGCGDFRVGRRIAEAGLEYVGVDIVQAVIARLQGEFGGERISFLHLDATKETPPGADLCLIRQVLQHLSNAEIAHVLHNCRHYPQILVTEHLPVGSNVIPNTDKPHGPDTRIYDNSGVFLDAPPFSLPIEVVLEVAYTRGEVLRSVLVRGEVATVGGGSL